MQVSDLKRKAPEKACKPGTSPPALSGNPSPERLTLPLLSARLRLEALARSSVRGVSPDLLRGRLPSRRITADANRVRNYGLDRSAFDALVLDSLGRCGLCDRPDDGTSARGLVIDHDHEHGVVRGLICNPCNRALHFVETYGYGYDWMARALSYARRARPRRKLA